jgi:hypothetical protein
MDARKQEILRAIASKPAFYCRRRTRDKGYIRKEVIGAKLCELEAELPQYRKRLALILVEMKKEGLIQRIQINDLIYRREMGDSFHLWGQECEVKA